MTSRTSMLSAAPRRSRLLACVGGPAATACAVVALWLSCAHAPPAASPPAPAPAWPMPPAPPSVRWRAAFPDLGAPVKVARPWWRRAARAVFGIEDAPHPSAPPLSRPFGVAAAHGQLVVADPDGRQVVRVDWRQGSIVPVACDGQPWMMPMAVGIAADGALYVADGGRHAIVRVEPHGGRCRSIGSDTLQRPTGVALWGDRVYAVDPPRHSVVGFDADGKVVVRFGGRGEGEGLLNFPTAIAARSDGRLVVVDALNFRIAEFTPDGKPTRAFGEVGDGGGAFGRPKAVAVDGAGRIYVSDVQHDVVLRFAASGAFDLAIGGSGAGAGQLTMPAGVAVDGDLLFVADALGGRIEIYDLLGASR